MTGDEADQLRKTGTTNRAIIPTSSQSAKPQLTIGGAQVWPSSGLRRMAKVAG